MSRWRVGLVLVLLGLPLLVLVGLGLFYVWQNKLMLYVWWPSLLCMTLGYLLAWYWQKKQLLLKPIQESAPVHWTDRDKQAWQVVAAKVKFAETLPTDRLVLPEQFLETGRELSLELAQHYHPGSADPISSLTVPEMLAVVELAAHDLADLTNKYLPAGHLLRVRDWQRAKQATEWYQTANQAYWAISAIMNPLETGLRWLGRQAGIARPFQMLQMNLQLWFFTAFITKLGTYLIDLNSGRLKVGASRYRELLHEAYTPSSPGEEGSASPGAASTTEPTAKRVTVTLLGQVKAGKSSLVNALLGEQRAKTAVVPCTDEMTRYTLEQPELDSTLVLQDTVGYGQAGPREDQLQKTIAAAQESDLLILVLHARNPGRQADLAVLRGLRAWEQAHPHFKLPPVLAVLTHIDLLSPALEWAPPYDWQEPKRVKEQQIAQAIATVYEALGTDFAGAVPVCVAAGKEFGVEEWLTPTLTSLLPEARGVAFLRCLRAEADAGKVKKVFWQMAAVGKKLLEVSWQGRGLPTGEPRR